MIVRKLVAELTLCLDTKQELSLRMAIFYSGSLLSGAFGSLIAAGILSGLDHARGMRSWQWLYIIEGSITVFVRHPSSLT